ncbi:zinc finger protein GLIS3 [Pieris rapae]|uniref:zinc finger protein GLIS3 n=1 Tax=Pieris rapae TaxID=64459 RepID=UPI001E27ECC9|nr:zinc finger protein GLIS3 [Pieris rapae]
MLLFPTWRPELHEGCRVPWIPTERFAPYIARSVTVPPPPPQISDSDSCGSLSPERHNDSGSDECICEWRGCGIRFDSVSRLSAHVARVHAHAHSDGYFYCCWRGCTRSQRGFNARYKMIVHMRIHTNERPHTCNQCQKSFSRAENLKIHLRSHSGEKPYVCPYEGCGKAYSNSSDRFKHTRTHKVDKPYCCKAPGCTKRYTDPSSLRKHVKAYKHFTEKEHPKLAPRAESISPMRETIEPVIDHRISPYSYHISESYPVNYHPTYIRTDPLYKEPQETYPVYTRMYDHALSYSTQDYPLYKPQYYESRIDVGNSFPENSDVPLNLICAKRVQCRPIEGLRHTELPLDLSTKS